MNSEKLLIAIGDIDCKYVREAMPIEQAKPYHRFVNTSAKRAVLALVTVILLLIAMVFSVSALREPVVQFLKEVYEIFFPGDEPEHLYELGGLEEDNPVPTTAVWQGSGCADEAAGFPGYTWANLPFGELEMRTEYALYGPDANEINATITNNSDLELMWWGTEYGIELQYWDGYGWHFCPASPAERKMNFEPLPPGETQATYEIGMYQFPTEGFYRMTVRARYVGEQSFDMRDVYMHAVLEISSSTTPRLTEELAAKLISVQGKNSEAEPYYPPLPIERPAEAVPFLPQDADAMQQIFGEVRGYVLCMMPAHRYKYWVQDDYAYLYFYREKTDEEAFLCLKTIGWEEKAGWAETAAEGDVETLNELPEWLLAAPAEIQLLRFADDWNVIQPPRGIQIGDPESRIFEYYPDNRRAGSEDVLYDVTTLYPWDHWAEPEKSNMYNGGFVGGRKEAHGNWVLLYAVYTGKGGARDWINPIRLEYAIKDGKIEGITFSRSFESN